MTLASFIVIALIVAVLVLLFVYGEAPSIKRARNNRDDSIEFSKPSHFRSHDDFENRAMSDD